MTRPYSLELKYVINEALDASEQLGEELGSLHLLFAMFMLDNSGGLLLSELGYDEEALLPYVRRERSEPEDASEELMRFAEETSVKYQSKEVNCLHLLVALCRHRKTLVYELFLDAGVSVPRVRNQAISLLVNGLPRRYSALFDDLTRRRIQLVSPSATPNISPPVATPSHGRSPAASAAPVARSAQKPVPASAGVAVWSPGGVVREVCDDLVELAIAGIIEPAIGRDAEQDEISDILNKRKANNPLIIGPPGTGKTALVEGLAWTLAFEPERLPGLEGCRIYRLELARLMKGTHMRGAFSDRINALRQELADSGGKAILFIDEIHSTMQGSVDGAQDIAQELKTALAQGRFSCIGVTTLEDYRQTIEKDPALARRFHLVELAEPDEKETLAIVASAATQYAEHHGLNFSEEALRCAVNLTNRYMRDRHQPDKSLSVLDLAGSRARRAGLDSVNAEEIAEVVSRLTAVPVDQLASEEADRFLNLEDRMSQSIIGHRDVLGRIADALRRNAAGFGGERPLGSFFFAGPTGVGKTEIAKALALELFGKRDALIRFDMSEYAEPHSVAKLIGAPPGYVGYTEGGRLTDAVRRHPFQILLFDEIEKAHSDVLQLFLQLLDDGRLTDNLGRTVDFSHTVVICTSNTGSEAFSRKGGFGFGGGSTDEERRETAVIDAVKNLLSPELYNRLDEKIVFKPLGQEEINAIASLLLKQTAETLRHERQIDLQFGPDVPARLAESGGYDSRFGARPMRRAIQRHIEGPIAERILRGDVRRGDCLDVLPAESGGFSFLVREPTE